jgi:hypothetical protein
MQACASQVRPHYATQALASIAAAHLVHHALGPVPQERLDLRIAGLLLTRGNAVGRAASGGAAAARHHVHLRKWRTRGKRCKAEQDVIRRRNRACDVTGVQGARRMGRQAPLHALRTCHRLGCALSVLRGRGGCGLGRREVSGASTSGANVHRTRKAVPHATSVAHCSPDNVSVHSKLLERV